jgi:hypothetical protein
LALYPRVEGCITNKHLVVPHIGGFVVAATSDKFAAKLNAKTDLKGLFFCGADIGTGGLAGEIQSGWIAANAALGYTIENLQANRNVVVDLQNI